MQTSSNSSQALSSTDLVLRSEWKTNAAHSHKWFADIGYNVAIASYNKLMAEKKEKREKLEALNNPTAVTVAKPETKKMFQSCQICKRPLGQESKDLGYPLCHNCRKCSHCGTETTPAESLYCIENNLAIKHARCVKLTDVNTLQEQVALVNYYRLLQDLTVQFPTLSFDQQYEALRRTQEIAAFMSVHLNMKKADLNKKLTQEKQETKKAVAEQQKQENVTGTKIFKKSKNLMATAISAIVSTLGGDKVKGTYKKACDIVLSEQVKRGKSQEEARLLVIEAMVSLGTPKEDAVGILDGRIA
jgi:hypothetical protein